MWRVRGRHPLAAPFRHALGCLGWRMPGSLRRCGGQHTGTCDAHHGTSVADARLRGCPARCLLPFRARALQVLDLGHTQLPEDVREALLADLSERYTPGE